MLKFVEQNSRFSRFIMLKNKIFKICYFQGPGKKTALGSPRVTEHNRQNSQLRQKWSFWDSKLLWKYRNSRDKIDSEIFKVTYLFCESQKRVWNNTKNNESLIYLKPSYNNLLLKVSNLSHFQISSKINFLNKWRHEITDIPLCG